VPGPPRTPAGQAAASDTAGEQPPPPGDRFADLDRRPVAEHVEVFEAEHSRLRRELGTIDQL
jgi:hypothetical protein